MFSTDLLQLLQFVPTKVQKTYANGNVSWPQKSPNAFAAVALSEVITALLDPMAGLGEGRGRMGKGTEWEGIGGEGKNQGWELGKMFLSFVFFVFFLKPKTSKGQIF